MNNLTPSLSIYLVLVKTSVSGYLFNISFLFFRRTKFIYGNEVAIIRKISISFNNLIDDTFAKTKRIDQISLFDSFSKLDVNYLEKEEKLQQTLLELKIKYGKNSILKAMDLEEGATTKERNEEIGGHKT